MAGTKLTVESSDDGIDKIVFKALFQYGPVLPSTAIRPKMSGKATDGFAPIATIVRFKKCVRMLFQSRQKTAWSMNVYIGGVKHMVQESTNDQESKFSLCHAGYHFMNHNLAKIHL